MPARELMNWEGDRWSKQHEGKRILVGPRTLRKDFPKLYRTNSRDGSRDAANAWWERFIAQHVKEPAPEVRHAVKAHEQMRDWFRQHGENELADNAQNAVEKLTSDGLTGNPMIDDPMGPVSMTNESRWVWQERFQAAAPVQNDRSVGEQIKAFLKFKRTQVEAGTITPDRWEVVRVHLAILEQHVGTGTDVSLLNEATVKGYWTHLAGLTTTTKNDERRSASYVHDVFSTFKQFVRELWGLRLIELPRNLDDKKLAFKRKDKEVITWTVEEINQFIDGASDRTKLYALLMLNCGFYSSDIATLEHQMVDWKAGRIIRKRHKTEDEKNAPKVEWKLWPATFALLKACRSSDPTFVLVNEEGGQLRTSSIDGEKFSKNDNIKTAFGYLCRKLKIEKTPKQLRKTSASMLEEHEVYGRYAQYFLGHSPRSVADKRYVKPSQDRFDAAIDWLGQQLFPAAKKAAKKRQPAK